LYKNVPNKIENYGNVLIAIRGEAILTYEDFEGMDGANPRNKCAGLLQSKNAKKEELEKIKFIPYSIVSISNINSDLKYMTKSDHFNFFKHNKFEEIPFQILEWNDLYGIHLIRNNIHPDLSSMNEKTLPVDGIVISRNKCIEYTLNIKDWETNKNLFLYTLSTKQIAFKYPDITKESEVISIDWKMSMGGKFIPVLKIKEIEIDGIKINNVTANNYKWLQEMGCGVGAKIKIRRANECIPNITETIERNDNFQIPSNCEYCDTPLKYDNYETHLICPNLYCEAKDIAIIYKIWNFIKPDGASDACFSLLMEKIKKTKILYTMINSTIITQFTIYLRNSDLWDKNPENHYHKLVKKTLINFTNTQASIPEIIKMANIPSIGIRIGDKIFRDCHKDPKIFLGYVETKFPESVIKYEILNKYKNNIEKILYIWDGKINYQSGHKQIIKVAITGSVSIPRNKWFKEMEKFGVKKSSVSKNCDFLICENESNSSSYKKAIKYQIPIVSESEFFEKTGINI
jgi:DNA ligase (NAD+)